uniref:Pentatricopeptide repeat-containing protein At2g37320 n=1 Tax=Anthurium amnicola TaxID=1678845 RepID=A0A1D1Z231_9ARAE
MYYLFLQAPVRPYFIISRHFFATNQALSKFRFIRSPRDSESSGLERALEVLELITDRNSTIGGQESHVRLIQSCLEDLLETSPERGRKLAQNDVHAESTSWIQLRLDNFEQSIPTCGSSGVCLKYDGFPLFQELHKRGTSLDATMVSGILSECGSSGYFRSGLQFHSLSVKTGLDMCSSVGSALISLYSKCGYPEDAYQIFDKMASRSTVLWTAIIAGYAQNWQVDTCLHLFVKMLQSTLKPNGYTLSSLLSACAGAGFLQLGKIVHSQEIQMGFNSYLHVSNALISMYSKCGSIHDAFCIFSQMTCRDVISWNSMISAYAQHGLAVQTLDLLRQMETENIAPDAVTFLGVLSSCRHAGLVEQGRQCFNSMLTYGLKPEVDHYSCIVDLLGRAGLLEEALDFIGKMPMHANAVIWASLLSSCRVYGNTWIGIQAAEGRLLLEPSCAATHVQLANLYASIGDWKQTAKVRKCMKDKGIRTTTGYSWIEVGNGIHKFKAEDRANAQVKVVIVVLDTLIDHMKSLGYNSKIKLDLPDETVHI